MTQEKALEKSVKLTRSTLVISGATMMSRILGLIRDMVIADLYPREVRDAFFIAFRIPNTFRMLLAEGALSAGFVPMFSHYFSLKSKREAFEFIRATFGLMLFILTVVTLGGMVLAPYLVRFLTLEFGPMSPKLALTIRLTRWLFPYMFFIGLAALAMGVLNTLGHFFLPAFSPALFNLFMILGALSLRGFFDEPVMALALGVLMGGLAQVLSQLPLLKKKEAPLTPSAHFAHPGLREMGLLMVPTVFGQAIGQMNLMVDTMLGWTLGHGMVSSLYYANRVALLVQGVFGVATATALLPTLSSLAARGETEKLKDSLTYGLRITLFLTIPSSLGLIALSRPIITLLFEHGQFDSLATRLTSDALLYYSLGLFAFGGLKVVNSAFYSLKDTKTPVKGAFFALILNIILNLILMRPMKQAGLALATSISFTFNFFLLLYLLRKRIGHLIRGSLLNSILQTLLASMVMFLGVLFISHGLGNFLDTTRKLHQLLQVGASVVGGTATFLLIAHLLDMEELKSIRRILWRGSAPP